MNNVLENVLTQTKKQYILAPDQHDFIKTNEANRVVGTNDPHVRKLAISMMENGYNPMYPIIIGPDKVIRAGHNRYAAAKIAKVPIFVEVDSNIEMNHNKQTKQDDIHKKWSTKDRILLNARKEKQAYLDLEQIIKGYPSFPIKVIIASVAGLDNQASGDVFETIRNGDFEFQKNKTRIDVEHELDEIQNLHNLILDENRLQGERISMHVGIAYLWLKSKNDFDKEWFEKNSARNRSMIVPQAGGTKANRKMLLDVYNKNLRKNHLSLED